MAATVTIRLAADDREVLEAQARKQGTGLSTLLRGLAEAEANRARSAAIRAEGQRIADYSKANSGTGAELNEIGTPQIVAP